MEKEIQKPECQLTGKDGNVFNIIGLVSKALKDAGRVAKQEGDNELAEKYFTQSKEFPEKAVKSKSYDDVLILCHDYVDVL